MADEIVFYNSGSLEFDPGTETNIERFEEETGISVEVNEVPWSNLKPASPRSGGTRTTRSTRSTVRTRRWCSRIRRIWFSRRSDVYGPGWLGNRYDQDLGDRITTGHVGRGLNKFASDDKAGFAFVVR